jgi:hypothetical protein
MRRFATLALLLLPGLPGAASAQDSPDERNNQIDKIKGTWQVIWMERAGEKRPSGVPEEKWNEDKAEFLRKAQLVVQIGGDGVLTLEARGTGVFDPRPEEEKKKGGPIPLGRAVYRLEYDGKRWVMITIDSKSQTERGIYELRPGRWWIPDTLVICTSMPGQEPPSAFAATETASLMRLRRGN